MKATRERQMRFMASFGSADRDVRKAVEAMLITHGAGWLTDEQMREITSHQVMYCRVGQRVSRRNRNLRSA